MGKTRRCVGESINVRLADYADLPALRQALTADDPDDRVDAYMAVRDAGLDPDDVLSQDPPETELEEAGVISSPDEDYITAGDHRRQVRDYLERIAKAVEGGN